MHEKKQATAASVLMTFAVGVCIVVQSSISASAQARGVIIQIPDDVMPGAPRPASPPAPSPPPVGSQPPPGQGPGGNAAATCPGPACVVGKDVWHVINTANRSCLALANNDLKERRDVRKLASLLPAPRFVVAPGGCP